MFAALLIVAGVMLLLWNFDVLPDGIWRALARFWPVVLLLIGANIFLRAHPWLAGLVVLLIMLATLGAAVLLATNNPQQFNPV